MTADEEKLPLSKEEQLEKETEKTFDLSRQFESFYELPEGSSWKEITPELLASSIISENQKERIIKNDRKIYLFSYFSDGLKVKGLVSVISGEQEQSTLVVLRGGNRIFGIPNPASILLTTGKSTVIGTLYRDGVSDGIDEFGGEDVNDVKNLIDYIPEIERQLGMTIAKEQMYLLGRSRGGMQMFLALARFPELQDKFIKAVSLSGLLDLRIFMHDREEMRKMFIEDFGLGENDDEEEWIDHRDPIKTVSRIRRDLSILIVQGTQDLRTSLEVGYSMLEKLKENGNHVTYWEIEGADHCLSNREDQIELIFDWLN